MKTMNKGILASSLKQTLRGRGPYTVFVPLDSAFDKLESGTFENLLKPEHKELLTAFLSRHVIAHKVNFKNLKDGDTLQTMGGSEVVVNIKQGKVRIDDAVIQVADIESSNGVIHSLNAVLKG